MVDQSAGEGDTLGHSAGEMMRIGIAKCFQPNQAHEFAHLVASFLQQSARDKSRLNISAYREPRK